MPFDRLYKRLLREFFPDFLRLFEKELARNVNETELLTLDKELLGADPARKRHEVDFLVRARLRGESAAFLIHVEAQAQHQPDFARRMFRYFARLHETHEMPVYPIAILAHASPHRPANDVYEVVVNGERVMHFRFRVVQLNRLRWQDYQDIPNPIAAAFMSRMHIKRSERGRVKWACYDLTARLGISEEKARTVLEFVEGHLTLDEREQAEFEAHLQASEPAIQEVVMKFSNQWVEKGRREGLEMGLLQGKQQGRQEGIREGIQEGIREGEQIGIRKGLGETLLRLLTVRFAPVPDTVREAVMAMPAETLSEIIESIFQLQSLDDLKRWL